MGFTEVLEFEKKSIHKVYRYKNIKTCSFSDVVEAMLPGNTGKYGPGINQLECVISGQYYLSGNNAKY